MRKGTRAHDWLPGFLMVPSIILVGIFVYWFILQNVIVARPHGDPPPSG